MTDGEDTALSADVMLVFYLDADGDGFGIPDDTALGCEAPDGYAENPDSTLIRPWYMDADDDGFGDPEVFLELCDQPAGYIADFSDCDDAREDISPADPEMWGDSTDNDCDGEIDEDDSVEGSWSGTVEMTIQGTGTYSSHYDCSGDTWATGYASEVGAVLLGGFSCVYSGGSLSSGPTFSATLSLTSTGSAGFSGYLFFGDAGSTSSAASCYPRGGVTSLRVSATYVDSTLRFTIPSMAIVAPPICTSVEGTLSLTGPE